MILKISNGPDLIILRSLAGKKNFQQLFQSGQRFVHSKAVLIVQFRGKETEGETTVFFGIAVRRKTKAVIRNRLKRLIREAMFRYFKAHPRAASHIHSIIILWRDIPPKASLIHLRDVEPVLQELFTQALQEA